MQMDKVWKTWKKCLLGEDINSIFRQINILFWDHAIYKVILKGRRNRIEEAPENATINDVYHSFINRNYFSNDIIRIRRLVDSNHSQITGHRGVFSLRSLIRDIEDHRTHLTREVFLRLRNLPYDFESVKSDAFEYILSHSPGEAFVLPSEYNWQVSYNAHVTFDQLSGTTGDRRQKEDIMRIEIFKSLHSKLDNLDPILNHAIKFIAHSATPNSRLHIDIGEADLVAKDIFKAHKTIFTIANFLASSLFSIERIPLPYEDTSFYKHWNAPLFRDDEVEDVKTVIDEFRRELETTMSLSSATIWGEIFQSRQERL